MNVHPLRTALAEDQIRVLLANREGLAGSARSRFWTVLDQYDAFHPVRFRRTWPWLLVISLVLVGLCYSYAPIAEPRFDRLVRLSSLLLCLVPIWAIRRQEQRRPRVDGETEWRAYCLFVRPLILAEHPGLLDRNLVPPASLPTRFVPRPVVLLREQIKVRGLDYWWSALGGTWVGMILLLVLQLLNFEPGRWVSLLLPVLGFLTGPIVGTVGQSLVYFLAQKDAADS